MTKIVFIDSENGVRELYAQLLEAAGYRVYQATTAQYGMWLCGECRPDLVITTRDPVDAELEHDYFVDVLRRRVGSTPVVVVAHDKNSDSEPTRGHEPGPHRYLELMDAIHNALGGGRREVRSSSGRIAAGAAS